MATNDKQRINNLKRISGSAHLIHQALMERPLVTPKWLQEKTRLSQATINTVLMELESLGIVKETTGQKRNRIYSYTEYIQILEEGTEALDF